MKQLLSTSAILFLYSAVIANYGSKFQGSSPVRIEKLIISIIYSYSCIILEINEN